MLPAHPTSVRKSGTIRKAIVTTVLTFSLLVAHAPSTFAQSASPVPVSSQTDSELTNTQVQLTAIPPRLGDDNSLRAQPGQTIQTSIRVRNTSSQSQTIETLVEDFIIGTDGEQPIPVNEETPTQWSLASWVSLSPTRQVVRPNETVTVNVLIEVPEDALPGGRYAMVMHQPVAEGSTSGTASGVSQRVGTLLYLVIEGDINEEAYITDVTVPRFSEFGPIPFSFTVDNRSDVHVRPMITVDVKNMLGQPSESLAVETKNIFPYTSRGFEKTWDRVWGFGRYTATITAAYGSQGRIAQQVVAFWIIPVKLLLAIGVAISTLAVIALLIRRHLLHRSNFQSQQIEMLEEKLKKLESDQEQRFRDDNH